MYALAASNGAIKWSYASGGSVMGGAAIVDGRVYWASGYYTNNCPAGSTTCGKVHQLLSFGLPGRVLRAGRSLGDGCRGPFSAVRRARRSQGREDAQLVGAVAVLGRVVEDERQAVDRQLLAVQLQPSDDGMVDRRRTALQLAHVVACPQRPEARAGQ